MYYLKINARSLFKFPFVLSSPYHATHPGEGLKKSSRFYFPDLSKIRTPSITSKLNSMPFDSIYKFKFNLLQTISPSYTSFYGPTVRDNSTPFKNRSIGGFTERGGGGWADGKAFFGFISCKVEIVLLIFTLSKIGFRMALCARLSSNFHDLFSFLFLFLNLIYCWLASLWGFFVSTGYILFLGANKDGGVLSGYSLYSDCLLAFFFIFFGGDVC